MRRGGDDDPDRRFYRDVAAEVVGLVAPGSGFARAAWLCLIEAQRTELRAQLAAAEEELERVRHENAVLIETVRRQAEAIASQREEIARSRRRPWFRR